MAETGDYHKYDYGKPRFDLIPMDAIIELAKLYAVGAEKYDDNGWLKNGGMDYHRIFRALMSHATRYWNGEDYDPVDGQHHMDSVAWCALALRTYDLRGLGNDDRPSFQADGKPGPSPATKEKAQDDQKDIEQWLEERGYKLEKEINRRSREIEKNWPYPRVPNINWSEGPMQGNYQED